MKKQTKEPLEDDIKSGSGPAEKNNSKKYTFECVKINFFGQTKGGALLKKNKKQENEKETRGVVKREKKNEKEKRGVKKQKIKVQIVSTKCPYFVQEHQK